MWKKRMAGIVIMCGLFLALGMPVYAGDINAAEQSIVAYYNGTVSYDGKTYQFTEDAKQRAYNRLISDDINLTDAQAAAAIRQANANLQQGISQGYLVEVGSDEPADAGVTEPGGAGQSGETEMQGGSFSDGDVSEPYEDGFEKEDEERQKYSDAQKTDINQFFQESLDEGDYAVINAGSQDNVVTVEQFLKGTVNVVAENGDVVLSTGLPIKNTGYYQGKVNLLPGLIGIACLILIAVFAQKKKHYMIAPVLCAAAGIAFVFAFAQGFIESELGKWNSVFLLGAPEYAYAAEAEDREGLAGDFWQCPLQGEQYGEILCEDIGLRVPLYYGDTDDVLEQGAGIYAGESLPGKGGRILVSGHDTTTFAPLESAQKGMAIQVRTLYGQYEYEVTKTEVMDVLEYSDRKAGTEAEELALYTCYPFGAETELRSERFFVYAKKVSGPEVGE